MRLAAVYLRNHKLFDGPQTFNLGGRFLYDFSSDGKKVFVNRKKNPEYIEDFFIETKSPSKLELLTAVVGENGSGKSSLLNVLRSKFGNSSYGFLDSSTAMLVEKDDESLPIILQSDFSEIFYRYSVEELMEMNNIEVMEIKLNSYSKDNFQTIYYSPHFDYTYNPNFDELDKYDISFDKLLEKDLSELHRKDSNQSGWFYKPSEELIFKNSLRQILFLNSKAVKTNQYFKDFFNLPEHGRACLVSRGYKKDDDWNTPMSFRPILKAIKEKIDKELSSKFWTKIKKTDKSGRVKNQVEVNKYLLKRYVIKDFISIVESQMEKYNSYLGEGDVDFNRLIEEMSALNAYDAFKLFILKSKISKHSRAFHVFDYKIIKSLFDLIYFEIDSAKSEQEVSLDRTFFASPEGTIKILELQREFLSNLFEYYPKLKEKDDSEALIREGSRIDGFINYLPTEKKLSSGENALLNLFSRIYDFIYSHISINNFLPSCQNYILLLDEADLSFHPNWKKQYILSLLNTIPHLFEDIKTQPSIQIIFTTHDPLTLSDIPNNNIIYLSKSETTNKAIVLLNDARPKKSFGANIHELLSFSFFLKTGHIGDFSKKKINWIIDELNKIIQLRNEDGTRVDENINKNRNLIKKTILMTGDDIIRTKLLDMYYLAFKDIEDINREIIELERKVNELKKRRSDD